MFPYLTLCLVSTDCEWEILCVPNHDNDLKRRERSHSVALLLLLVSVWNKSGARVGQKFVLTTSYSLASLFFFLWPIIIISHLFPVLSTHRIMKRMRNSKKLSVAKTTTTRMVRYYLYGREGRRNADHHHLSPPTPIISSSPPVSSRTEVTATSFSCSVRVRWSHSIHINSLPPVPIRHEYRWLEVIKRASLRWQQETAAGVTGFCCHPSTWLIPEPTERRLANHLFCMKILSQPFMSTRLCIMNTFFNLSLSAIRNPAHNNHDHNPKFVWYSCRTAGSCCTTVLPSCLTLFTLLR